jgi:hypothetical protein
MFSSKNLLSRIAVFSKPIACFMVALSEISFATEADGSLSGDVRPIHLTIQRSFVLAQQKVVLVADAEKATERSISSRVGRLSGEIDAVEIGIDKWLSDVNLDIVLRRDPSLSIPMRARQTIRIGPFKGSLPLDGDLFLDRLNIDIFFRLPFQMLRYQLNEGRLVEILPAIHLHRIDFDLQFTDGFKARQQGIFPTLGLKLQIREGQQIRPNIWMYAQALRTDEFSFQKLNLGVDWHLTNFKQLHLSVNAGVEANRATFRDLKYTGQFDEVRPYVGIGLLF